MTGTKKTSLRSVSSNQINHSIMAEQVNNNVNSAGLCLSFRRDQGTIQVFIQRNLRTVQGCSRSSASLQLIFIVSQYPKCPQRNYTRCKLRCRQSLFCTTAGHCHPCTFYFLPALHFAQKKTALHWENQVVYVRP
ncbi:uncharacterized protein LOC116014112 isoform X3 [Ipomoea triloba]|uniref:uncharacterized protein LOC116014112 isoform X3 n=1 Tax=Ipomoea triloba TaxID=35885 RepID=UPI00125D3718|nr:uncharacterized protein LOC116014112 isoform X3 [Ipomoea triloba]